MSTGLFDVFIEGSADPSPEGISRAAQALAPKLGLPPTEVVRLLRGRFRVRGAVDAPRATRLQKGLEALGARVQLVTAQVAAASSASGGPAAVPMDDDGISISGLFPLPGASEPGRPQTILPSSFGPDDGMADLGGLDLGLPPPPPVAPPKAPKTAVPPATPPAAAARKPPVSSPPPDENLFAPPDEASDDPLDLVAPIKPAKTKTRMPVADPIPPSAVVSTVGTAAASGTTGQQPSASRTLVGQTSAAAPTRPALIRLSVVLALALGIGAIPATLYARHVDKGRVRNLQMEFQDLVINPWKGEEVKRNAPMVREEIANVRWNATLVMMMLWAAAAGLLATLALVFF